MNVIQLKVSSFRNLVNLELNLKRGVTVFYGLNGQGKTNLVESIFVLSKTHSFRTFHHKELIQYDKTKSTITAKVHKNSGTHSYQVDLTNQGKICYINKNKVLKISEYLGNIKAISFIPEDVFIFKESPHNRRWLLDSELASLFPLYMKQLIVFQKIMEQRNALLKQINAKQKELLDVIDNKLIEVSYELYSKRCWLIEQLNELLPIIFKKMSGEDNQVSIVYKTYLNQKDKETYLKQAKEILETNLNKDIEKTFTQVGIHKDDFEIYLNQKNISLYASQGQQRLMALSIKLALVELIKKETNEEPILILDDVFSELDTKKRKALLNYILDKEQVFVTCTHYQEVIQEDINQPIEIIKIQQGKVVERGVIYNGRKQS